MNLARVIVDAVAVFCPHCDKPIVHPKTGSQLWCPADFEVDGKRTQFIKQCPNCKKKMIVKLHGKGDVAAPNRDQKKEG